jgi:phage-related protein
MKKKFEVQYSEETIDFLLSIDSKASKKIFYNIDKAKKENNPKLFKKLNGNIWEFRTLYNGLHYRLLAFWDKDNEIDTLVIATHGFVKKLIKYLQKK